MKVDFKTIVIVILVGFILLGGNPSSLLPGGALGGVTNSVSVPGVGNSEQDKFIVVPYGTTQEEIENMVGSGIENMLGGDDVRIQSQDVAEPVISDVLPETADVAPGSEADNRWETPSFSAEFVQACSTAAVTGARAHPRCADALRQLGSGR